MGYIGEEKRITYNRKYDDPYRVLAAYIVANLTDREIDRMFHGTAYLKSVILEEARTMDIGGPFLDCLDEEVIANDRKRSKNYYLNKLGEFYFQQLDVVRLRREVILFSHDVGRNIKFSKGTKEPQ